MAPPKKPVAQCRTASHPFQIRANAVELEAWKDAAGATPTSTWARDVLNKAAKAKKREAN